MLTKVTVCECTDSGCPHCHGTCEEMASVTLYRVDMHDETGVCFCDGCFDDAFEAGVFSTSPPSECPECNAEMDKGDDGHYHCEECGYPEQFE